MPIKRVLLNIHSSGYCGLFRYWLFGAHKPYFCRSCGHGPGISPQEAFAESGFLLYTIPDAIDPP